MSKQDKVQIVISSQEPIQLQEFNWDDEEQALTEVKAKPDVKKASWLSGVNPKNWPSWLRYVTIRTIGKLLLIAYISLSHSYASWLHRLAQDFLEWDVALRRFSAKWLS